MKITESYLRKLIRQELLKEQGQLDRHEVIDGLGIIQKLNSIRQTLPSELITQFTKLDDNLRFAIMKYMNENRGIIDMDDLNTIFVNSVINTTKQVKNAQMFVAKLISTINNGQLYLQSPNDLDLSYIASKMNIDPNYK